jgi:tetratricopeptide (TPR) repeat protein
VIDARVSLGLYLAQMIYDADAKAAIDPIIDLAKKHNDKRRLCQIYTILGVYYCFVEDNYIEAFKALEEALKTSEEIKDFITSVLASLWFGCLLGWNCEFEKAEQYIQKALDINLTAKNLWGIAVMKSNLACFGYHYPGKINLGFQITDEAVRTAEESGDSLSKGISYVSHGMSCFGKGLLGEAEKHFLKGLNFSERINLHSWNAIARIFLGEIYFETGDFPRSKEHYEKGSWILDHNRLWPSLANLGKVGLVRSMVLNKEKDMDLESLYVHSRNNKVRAFEGWIQRYIGQILLNVDNQHIPEAEHWIQKSIEADQRNRMMFYLGKDYALYAELFKRKGDRLKARENLGRAIQIFKECGADGWVEKYEKELAMIS